MGKNREIMDMDQNKVAFISCVNDEDMYSECLLYLKSLYIPDGMSIEYIPVRNAASMCAGYNEGARASDAKYKIYLHQDVLVVNKNIIADLLSIFEDPTIGLVGMIGCRSLPRSGCCCRSSPWFCQWQRSLPPARTGGCWCSQAPPCSWCGWGGCGIGSRTPVAATTRPKPVRAAGAGLTVRHLPALSPRPAGKYLQ